MDINQKNKEYNHLENYLDSFSLGIPSTNPLIEENIEEEVPVYSNWESLNNSNLEFYPQKKSDEFVIGIIKVPN